jgi:hypothetical protein
MHSSVLALNFSKMRRGKRICAGVQKHPILSFLTWQTPGGFQTSDVKRILLIVHHSRAHDILKANSGCDLQTFQVLFSALFWGANAGKSPHCPAQKFRAYLHQLDLLPAHQVCNNTIFALHTFAVVYPRSAHHVSIPLSSFSTIFALLNSFAHASFSCNLFEFMLLR